MADIKKFQFILDGKIANNFKSELDKLGGTISGLNDTQVVVDFNENATMANFKKLYQKLEKENSDLTVQFRYDINKLMLENAQKELSQLEVYIDTDKANKEILKLVKDLKDINLKLEVDGITESDEDKLFKQGEEIAEKIGKIIRTHMSIDDSSKMFDNLSDEAKEIIETFTSLNKIKEIKPFDTKNIEKQRREVESIKAIMTDLEGKGAISSSKSGNIDDAQIKELRTEIYEVKEDITLLKGRVDTLEDTTAFDNLSSQVEDFDERIKKTNDTLLNLKKNIKELTGQKALGQVVTDMSKYGRTQEDSGELLAYSSSSTGYTSDIGISDSATGISKEFREEVYRRVKAEAEAIDTQIHSHPDNEIAAASFDDIGVMIRQLEDGITKQAITSLSQVMTFDFNSTSFSEDELKSKLLNVFEEYKKWVFKYFSITDEKGNLHELAPFTDEMENKIVEYAKELLNIFPDMDEAQLDSDTTQRLFQDKIKELFSKYELGDVVKLSNLVDIESSFSFSDIRKVADPAFSALTSQVKKAVEKGYAEGQDSHSPSKEAEKLNDDFVAGVEESANKNVGKLTNIGEQMAENVKDGFKEGMSDIDDTALSQENQSSVLSGNETFKSDIEQLQLSLQRYKDTIAEIDKMKLEPETDESKKKIEELTQLAMYFKKQALDAIEITKFVDWGYEGGGKAHTFASFGASIISGNPSENSMRYAGDLENWKLMRQFTREWSEGNRDWYGEVKTTFSGIDEEINTIINQALRLPAVFSDSEEASKKYIKQISIGFADLSSYLGEGKTNKVDNILSKFPELEQMRYLWEKMDEDTADEFSSIKIAKDGMISGNDEWLRFIQTLPKAQEYLKAIGYEFKEIAQVEPPHQTDVLSGNDSAPAIEKQQELQDKVKETINVFETLEKVSHEALSKSFSTSNKTQAFEQLKASAEEFYKYWESADEHTRMTGRFSEEGTKAAYNFYQSLEEALRKEVAQGRIEKVIAPFYDNPSKATHNLISSYNTSLKWGGTTILDEYISTYEERLNKFATVNNDVSKKSNGLDIFSNVTNDIKEFVDALEVAITRSSDFDESLDTEYIKVYFDMLQSRIEGAISEFSELKRAAELDDFNKFRDNASPNYDDYSVANYQKLEDTLLSLWEQVSNGTLTSVEAQAKYNEELSKTLTYAQEYEQKKSGNKTPLSLYEDSDGQLSFIEQTKKTVDLIEEESGQMSMFENVAEKATDSAIEGQMTLNDIIEKNIDGQMTLNDLVAKQEIVSSVKVNQTNIALENITPVIEDQNKLQAELKETQIEVEKTTSKYQGLLNAAQEKIKNDSSGYYSNNVEWEALGDFQWIEVAKRGNFFDPFEENYEKLNDSINEIKSNFIQSVISFDEAIDQLVEAFKKYDSATNTHVADFDFLNNKQTNLNETILDTASALSEIEKYKKETSYINDILSTNEDGRLNNSIKQKYEELFDAVKNGSKSAQDAILDLSDHVDLCLGSTTKLENILNRTGIKPNGMGGMSAGDISYETAHFKIGENNYTLLQDYITGEFKLLDAQKQIIESYKDYETALHSFNNSVEKLKENQEQVSSSAKETADAISQVRKASLAITPVTEPIKDTLDIPSESSDMEDVANLTDKAVQAKKDFATANEGVQGSVDDSKSKLELEAELMESIAKNAREAANAKKEFVKANQEVKESTDETSRSLKSALSSATQVLSNNQFKYIKLSKRDEQTSEYTDKLNEYNTAITNLKNKINNLNENGIKTDDDLDELEKLKNKVKEVAKEIDIMSVSEKGTSGVSSSAVFLKIEKLRDTYKGMSKEMRIELDAMEQRFRSMGNSINVSDAIRDLKRFETQLLKTGTATKTIWSAIKDKAFYGLASQIGTIFGFNDIIQMLRQAYQYVAEIDKQMIELEKVSDMSSSRLAKSFEHAKNAAKDLGSTVSDVISATADWSRLGYDADAAEQLAEVAIIYKNVGDGIDISTANESLISTLQGFKMEASQAMEIVDSFNEVANQMPIDSAGIGEALQRSAAAFNAANTDLNSAIALITATNSVLQNPEKVGRMWTTVSARIRGAKQELADAGEETDGMVESTSKLRELVKGLTGFDIMVDDNNFKDMKEIIVGIGKEWDKLSDIDQAGLLEALAGKNQSNALAAALSNYKMIEEAYAVAENSAGSAMREQEKWEQGLEARTNKLKASLETLSTTVLDSDFLGGLIDLGRGLIDIITEIIDKFGVLKTLLVGGGGIFAAIKSFQGNGRLKKSSLIFI